MIVKKAHSTYFVSTILVVFGLLCLLGIMKKFQTPKKIPYVNVEIGYNQKSKTKISDHAIKIDQGKFLLAVDSPSELDLALEFSSSRNVTYSIKPLYPNWICKRQGINQAYLSLVSDGYSKKWRLINGKTISVDTKVRDGERLKVSIENSHQKDCGRAEVTIERESNQNQFLGAFIIIWPLVFAAFIYLGVPIRFAAVGITLNLLTIYANASLTYLAFDISISALALSVSFISLLVLLHHLKIHSNIKGTISAISAFGVLMVLAFYIGYYLLFAVPVSNEVIHALWQSDIWEALEFIEANVGLWAVIASCLLLLALWRIFSFKSNYQTVFSAAFASLAMLVPALIVIPNQLSVNPMLKIFSVGTSEYFREIDGRKEWKKLREKTQPLPDAILGENGRTLVVVLGESANKNHMSLYGYPRDTTPNADRLHSSNDLIRFSRAYASYTHTGGAVAHALTQADQYTNSSWMTAPSILSLANSLGIETTWITNQQTFGAWDNQVSILAEEANTVISKNKKIGTAKDADKYDGTLLPALAKALEKDSPHKLIFLHLQGSHASYCRRFPDDNRPFYGQSLLKRDFGALALGSKHGVVNCYDNSIYYTDHVLYEVVSLLDSRNDPVSLLYFSDHSEDVFSGKAHNKDVFTYDMVEIPMFFWANENWKQTFSNLWESLSINSDQVFTNDHVFETLSGVMGINSKAIDAGNDLSSDEFEPVEEPLTLLRYKKLADSANWRFWQAENTKQVLLKRQCSKLLPHRTNTIGKISAALSAGLSGFEIDIMISGADATFAVGHDSKSLTDTNLDNVLETASWEQTTKIWLDIKNANQDNISLIISRLNYLDRKHNLKSKAIIEISYFGANAKLISDAGYQLSYYLPTGAVLGANSQSDSEIRELAKELLKRVELMQPRAISFDLRLYPFVKSYMEPSISQSIDYHTWFPNGLNFQTPNLNEKLAERDYYQDPRIKTILIPYHSPFQY